MTTHLGGCRVIEDLVNRTSVGFTDLDAPPEPERELSEAEKALADSYERYADQLAEIEALRTGRPAI